MCMLIFLLPAAMLIRDTSASLTQKCHIDLTADRYVPRDRVNSKGINLIMDVDLTALVPFSVCVRVCVCVCVCLCMCDYACVNQSIHVFHQGDITHTHTHTHKKKTSTLPHSSSLQQCY